MNVNQQYWNSKELLKQTGALDKPAPIQIKERVGMGVIGKNGVVGNAVFANGYIDTNMIVHKRGHAQHIDLAEGVQTISLDFNSMDMIKSSLAVYKNGGESLEEGRDYIVDYAANVLRLTRPTTSMDDDIEIRCQIDTTNDYIINHVLLLPRTMGDIEFDMEQLCDLLPNTGDIFEVDKLLRYNNTALVQYAGKKIKVLEAGITDEGIIGKMLII